MDYILNLQGIPTSVRKTEQSQWEKRGQEMN